jgi:N-methylhydantoinase A
MNRVKIGVDVGGTFTDIVGIDDNGKVFYAKTPSTPQDQSIGVVTGIRRLLADLNMPTEAVRAVAHGTTVATNTLLERNGAVTALITTEGFRDVLHIGRQSRPFLYDLHARRPDPLIPRYLRQEASERTDYTGAILVTLNEEGLRKTVRELVAEGVQSIAVCFLHAYANAENEQRALKVIKEEAPQLYVSVSSDILPEFREFERMNTTVINAYVQPRMDHYVSQLTRHITEAGVKAPLTIMKSTGGMMTDAVAASKSVNTLLSGPAGGVLAAEFLSNISGYKNLITCDMGGTSFDVAVIQNGQVGISNEGVIEGFPVMFPHIDISTIGAGGGSIAWIDTGGALRVGPKSAGAVPGPVCYSKGGTEPAITDAHAAIGFIGTELLAGEMKIDVEAARRAIKEKLADRLGMSIEETAEGILRVSNANMIRAIRTMTVEKGIDPRKFALLPFGGAGALQAVEHARALDIKHVIIPPAPGNFSAFGLLAAPIRYDEVVTYRARQDMVDLKKIESLMRSLEKSALDEMERDEVDPSSMSFEYSADIRYFGQAYSLSVRIHESSISEQAWDQLIIDFHQCHIRSYGFKNERDPIEVVNLRLAVIEKTNNASLYAEGEKVTNPVVDHTTRSVYIKGNWVTAQIYKRDDLPVGYTVYGPAVIEEQGCTSVLGPGDVATVDSRMAIVVTVASVRESEDCLHNLLMKVGM